MRGSLDDLYLEYLYDRMGLPKRGRNRTYLKLFRQMYTKEFVWVIHKDSSRAEDGKELRWEFVKAAGIPKVEAKWLYRPCSILEMIIGVSKRIAMLTDSDIRQWFFQLLVNLGLDGYSDMYYDGYIMDIDEKMECLNWRTYQPNGEGGLFPLHNPVANQRGVEIWYQMNAWLIERERGEG